MELMFNANINKRAVHAVIVMGRECACFKQRESTSKVMFCCATNQYERFVSMQGTSDRCVKSMCNTARQADNLYPHSNSGLVNLLASRA